jgi:hypothetical protein
MAARALITVSAAGIEGDDRRCRERQGMLLSNYHHYYGAQPKLQEGETKRHLYHYTSIQGAQGIVGERELWASNIHYMNDYTEYTHGIDIMIGELRALASDPSWSSRAAILTKTGLYIDRMRTRHIFATSFSERDDALSQWRGYAAGGICLGFLFGARTTVARPQNFHLL